MRIFVALGRNQISKLIRAMSYLSIDFSAKGQHNPVNTWFKFLLTKIFWWVLVSTDRLMIAWLLSGNLKTAGLIMSLEIFTKMSLYYVH